MSRFINFILQGKGGSSKTFVAYLLSQYLSEKLGEKIENIDLDPVNHSFSRFENLNVEKIEVNNSHNTVDISKFDELIEKIAQSKRSFVIDTGASIFAPLVPYLYENEVVELLTNLGCTVVMHCPIAGKDYFADCLNGLQYICENHKEKSHIIVWKNEYKGKLEYNGKFFEDLTVYKNYKQKIYGFIDISIQQDSLFAKDINAVINNSHTLDHALGSKDYNLMQKQRIKIIQRRIIESIDNINLYNKITKKKKQ